MFVCVVAVVALYESVSVSVSYVFKVEGQRYIHVVPTQLQLTFLHHLLHFMSWPPPHVAGECDEVPPGLRFHPTEEELLQYYLKKKVGCEKIELDVIQDVDLNKLEPWDIQEKCKIGSSSTPQNDWYFFSHKDKKYPTGTRTNRATCSGFWKATGRDKVIYGNYSRRIGMRKTLVFYKGRAPKSEWIMHEYRLHHIHHHNIITTKTSTNIVSNEIVGGLEVQEDGWVICRVFKKKNQNYSSSKSNHQISSNASCCCWSMSSINTHASSSCNEAGTLEQMLHYSEIGSSRNDHDDDDDELSISEHHPVNNNSRRLPNLEYYDIVNPSSCCINQMGADHEEPTLMINVSDINGNIQEYWASDLDRLLVASHLNTSKDHGHDSRLLMTSFVDHFHASTTSSTTPATPYNQPHHLWTSPI